ncbi:hypothetical protein SprV_0902710200 [Sparganum proliferum]
MNKCGSADAHVSELVMDLLVVGTLGDIITETDSGTAGFSCPPRPRTLTSRIGLVGHLRIHRTETGEPEPTAPAYIRFIHLHCPH